MLTKSADVVNGFTSTATDKALSAAAGKTLFDQIGSLLKVKSMTKTYTSNGNGDIISDISSSVNVIGATGGVIVSGIYNDKWVFVLYNHGTGAANIVTKPNSEVTITVYYVE